MIAVTPWWLDHAEIALYSSPYSWLIGGFLAWLWARRKLIPQLKQHRERLIRVEDELNTSTPGGLTDVVDRLASLERTATTQLAASRGSRKDPL